MLLRAEANASEILKSSGREIDPGELPTRLRLLCVGAVEPSWVGLTLSLDARGCVEPSFNWVSTANEALTLLRDESFDCLLIRTQGLLEQGDHDPLALARGIRAGGCSDSVVVVTRTADDETWAEAFDLHVDLLVSVKGWESTALVPAIQRAVERGQMLREIGRLITADRRRLARDRDEAGYLLRQQHEILQALDRERGSAPRQPQSPSQASVAARLPVEFDNYYQELVRTYVIMGSGTLVAEVSRLAEILVEGGLTPPEVLDFHLLRVEKLVQGLGNRSTRHVMARADLLALELMVHLGACYQRRLLELSTQADSAPGPHHEPQRPTPDCDSGDLAQH
ncbi:MAG: hypothetical protein EXS05_19630 [Planctomycetaceae bacterium]|nr:hypothetical protein [Planctomycetaceae bacterium]